jgi:hypothetical protein
MRALLDTMIFDKIIADDALRGDVLSLIAAEQLIILTTHIQEDQIAQIKDSAKCEAINTIRRTTIPTGAAVYDHSKYDASEYGSGAGPVKIEDVFRGNPKDIPDALIGATLSHADVLVTDDRTFRNRTKPLARERYGRQSAEAINDMAVSIREVGVITR